MRDIKLKLVTPDVLDIICTLLFWCDMDPYEQSEVHDIKFPSVILPHSCMAKPGVPCLHDIPPTALIIRYTAFGTRQSQVKRAVHERIGKLLAWSMSWASAGTFPSRGFQGEEFDPKSYRFSRKGSPFHNGWRQVWLKKLLLVYE